MRLFIQQSDANHLNEVHNGERPIAAVIVSSESNSHYCFAVDLEITKTQKTPLLKRIRKFLRKTELAFLELLKG